MTTGVSFGNKHSYRDFKTVMSSRTIGLPTVQTSKISVPGRDGDLDLTEALDGAVHYGNRVLEITLSATDRMSGKTWAETLADIAFHIHGKRLQIVFDDDSEYYYTGRCTISRVALQMAAKSQSVTIVCDCQPYKISVDELTVQANVNPAYRTIVIENGRMPSVPSFTFSDPCWLNMNGETRQFDVGTYSSKDLILAPGRNTVYVKTVEDVGLVTIRYRKGDL